MNKTILILFFTLFTILPVLSAVEPDVMIIDNNRVGINNNTPTEALDIVGNVKISGSLTVPKIDNVPKTYYHNIKADLDAATILYPTDKFQVGDHVIILNTNHSTVQVTNLPKISELLVGECVEIVWDGFNWHVIAAPLSTPWPIGITYTQYPGQKDPITLKLPGIWENISASYAGNFFRSEDTRVGSLTLPFDDVPGMITAEQKDAFQGHHHTSPTFFHTNGEGGGGNRGASNFPSSGKIGNPTTDGVNGTPRTATETRPVNRTIRIWLRKS